ncbi:MAG: site-specific DNA-methyltransferase [Clostridiaceae bacterium]|nr:site-specific DNA-methyltransferase [Clostridiaceae bacterium]
MEILLDLDLNNGVHKWEGTAYEKNWTLFCGNAVESLRNIESESVHCVITSPPYYSLRDYGVDGQIGLENTVDAYVTSLCEVMDELYRVLRKDGILFLNLGDTYYSGKGASHGTDAKSHKRRFGLRPVDRSGGLGANIERKSIIGVPWRVAIEMTSRKWVLRSPIIWHRDKALPESVRDRPHRSYEYIFMFAKDRKYFFNRQPLLDKQIDEDVWTITPRPSGSEIETAPYPDELVSRCLAIGCPEDGVVLDPFAGSGTTMKVALSTGRSAIGIDISYAFCEYILEHLEEEQ